MAYLRLKVLFEKYGSSDYIGEPVSIMQHSLQAAYFADLHFKKNLIPLDSTAHGIIIASLLHDIGHMMAMEAEISEDQHSKCHVYESMDNCGVVGHEHIAADFLVSLGFPVRVANMVGCHVPAKRYLCGRRPEYYSKLSEASKTTLRFQGGPMSEQECLEFEKDAEQLEHALLVRSFDEMAKEVNLVGKVPQLQDYRGMIESMVSQERTNYCLSSLQIEAYREYGFLKVCNLLEHSNIKASDLISYVEEISQWDCSEGLCKCKWLQHYELVDTSDGETDKRVLCRTENFVNYHDHMKKFVNRCLCSTVTQLLNEEGILFKEKINFKHPSGAGFSCHQDTPAYIGMGTQHISVMVAVDKATIQNGCLEVATSLPESLDSTVFRTIGSAGCRRWGPDQVPLDKQTGVVTLEAETAMLFMPVQVLSIGAFVILNLNYLALEWHL